MSMYRKFVWVVGLGVLISCSVFRSEGPGAFVEYRLAEIRFRFTKEDRLCVTPGLGEIVTDPEDGNGNIKADRIVFEDVDGSELVIRGADLSVTDLLDIRIDHAGRDRPANQGDAREEVDASYEFWERWAQRHDGVAEDLGKSLLPEGSPPIFDKRTWGFNGNFPSFPDNGVMGVGVTLKPFPERLITLISAGSPFATIDDGGGPNVSRPFLDSPEFFLS